MPGYIKNKVRNLINGVKSGGIEYLLYSIGSHFPEWLFRYYHAYLIEADDLKLITRDYKDYEIRFATLDDIDNLKSVEIDREKARHRLERGDTCVIVLKDGRVVCISWAATGRLYNRYAGSIVNTGDDGLFLYGVYSIPEERMKGFFGSCFKMQIEFYAARNRTRKYGVVEILNMGSLKVHLRMGFKTTGETYYIAILGMSICYYKTWPNRNRKFHIFFQRPPDGLEWV
ncbi:MAG: hypothetical protein AB1746_13780 [Candidatus Zixiibacteriota bacterium]